MQDAGMQHPGAQTICGMDCPWTHGPASEGQHGILSCRARTWSDPRAQNPLMFVDLRGLMLDQKPMTCFRRTLVPKPLTLQDRHPNCIPAPRGPEHT